MIETISENDFLQTNSEINANTLTRLLKEQNTLRVNDLVIHVDYGLGKFAGLTTIRQNGIENDFIKIEYRDNASLLIPVENCDLITKYSNYNESIILDKLGKSNVWNEKKIKIRQQIQKIASDLLDIAAKRQLSHAQIFTINNGEFEEFCKVFPHELTKDQQKAVEEIADDLASGKVMDRLLCGDVGFGKTEVAIRASFIVATNKYKAQVAIIAPTTLLCRQHYKRFCERFINTNVVIKSLSRFTPPKEARQIKEQLKNGEIDIIIGTHALLSKSIEFKNLGLVVIDEEQAFGVAQKEKLKALKNNCHILSMSATPIPRTLQMSISGIRDLSLLTTPPLDRINVETHVIEYDNEVIRQAIQRELERNGRVFFIVPRIADIKEVEARLDLSIPNILHKSVNGQMNNEDIDNIMNEFYDGKFKVLIATTIIESGLDIPMANTMIIYKANDFGLAQLYQLRGRVGRSNIQAYAYLTTKRTDEINEIAKKRLNIIGNIKSLNSGFVISSEDMDIRGAGNILGEKQTGHIREIGIELYNQMLKDAIKNKKNDSVENIEDMDFSPEIKINVSTIIPNNYIDNINIKMKYYRRIADICTVDDKDKIEQELQKEYGTLPDSVVNLLNISLLKIRCKKLNIQKLEKQDNCIVIYFYKNKFAKPDKLIDLSFKNWRVIKLKQDKLLYSFDNKLSVFTAIDKLLNILEHL